MLSRGRNHTVHYSHHHISIVIIQNFESQSSVPASGSSVKHSATRDSCGVSAPGGMTSSWPGWGAFFWYVVKPNRRSTKIKGMKEHDEKIKITIMKYPHPGYWVGTTSACQWNGTLIRHSLKRLTLNLVLPVWRPFCRVFYVNMPSSNARPGAEKHSWDLSFSLVVLGGKVFGSGILNNIGSP